MARTATRTETTKAQHRGRLGGGSKLARTETVTVRLDPRLRYLAELGARKQRRTLSSFIEWAVEDALKRLTLGDDVEPTIEHEARTLWDIDEVKRFVRLAASYPELMTYDEQVVWNLLNDSFLLTPANQADRGWNWEIMEESVIPVLRDYWPNLMMAALGPTSEQREWIEQRRSEVAKGEVYPDVSGEKK